ncbi:tripartite motif-containing protein 35-like [Astyanax mexicanus]|uniref:Tripartite motif-containing protein 35-like n=1 Tax=Astyanax mexicanus TaxID=7994 RepID=A0A8B9JTT5_ASTMX|nr:tripartite motif-containing protein 35-like [Astyanax mexicanus]
MAAALVPLHQDLSCPICLEIFSDPVMLTCGHSFCRTCLQKSWTQNPERECPVCRRRSSRENPPADLTLRNTCESYLQQQKKEEGSRSQGALCSLHFEKLNLFCVDDEKLVCGQCVTQDHQNHSFCSISKAAHSHQLHKETLHTQLENLEEKLKNFKNVKDISDAVAAHIKTQFQQTERKIREEFEKFYQFLRKEEEVRISDLRKEEEKKSQKMKKNIEDLDKQMKEISSRIKELQDKQKDDTMFLQDFRKTSQRAQYTMPDPKPDSEALIDVAKHLGNLSFNVWKKMKGLCTYYPVVLDPNTVNPSLSISADLSSVSLCTENHQLPDNPERMSVYEVALGSEGFSKGTHSWVVDVGDSENWIIGVAEESVSRKERCTAVPENGFFCIWRWGSEFAAATSENLSEMIMGTSAPRLIRVTLFWKKGWVTFSNAENKTMSYTLRHTFTKKMYPYFYNNSNNPLKILSIPIAVKVKPKRHSTN